MYMNMYTYVRIHIYVYIYAPPTHKYTNTCTHQHINIWTHEHITCINQSDRQTDSPAMRAQMYMDTRVNDENAKNCSMNISDSKLLILKHTTLWKWNALYTYKLSQLMRSGKNQLRKRKPRFLKLRKTRMQIIISIKCNITVTVTKLRCLMSIKNYTTQNDKYEYPHQRAVFHILPWLLHDSLKRLVSTRCKLRRLVPNDRITVNDTKYEYNYLHTCHGFFRKFDSGGARA
jgi:hypothetical protein